MTVQAAICAQRHFHSVHISVHTVGRGREGCYLAKAQYVPISCLLPAPGLPSSHATWRTRQKHCARRKTSPHLANIGASLEDIAAGAIGTIFQSTVDNEAKHFNYYDPQKKDKHYICAHYESF